VLFSTGTASGFDLFIFRVQKKTAGEELRLLKGMVLLVTFNFFLHELASIPTAVPWRDYRASLADRRRKSIEDGRLEGPFETESRES